MTAEAIAKALGGRKAGGTSWVAHCPAHDDREPSLSIRQGGNGKVLVYCHAGCNQARVISALRARGLWQPGHRHRGDNRFTHTEAGEAKRQAALGIWSGSRPAEGTPVENYLRSRGLTIPIPLSIRFHVGLKHPSGGVWPAMVALVSGADGKPLGIHRTFLTSDGNGKAPVDPQKMLLGPCRGGAVRLGPAGNMLMVGEGIETCLAAMQATHHPAWAALSTSGLRAIDLPREVRDVIVLADGDDPGDAAAQACALRWKREGRRVRIARPPRGFDFNDLLMRRQPHIKEAAE